MTAASVTTKLASWYPLPEGSEQYPFEFIEANGAIKLKETEAEIAVGLTGKTDATIQETIRTFHRKPVRFVELNAVELSAYLGEKLGESADPLRDGAVTGADNGDANGVANGADRVLLDKLANDAPIVNLVNSICIEGIHSHASDIHIEAGMDGARVRYRLDGVLRTVRTIENSRFPAVSSRIKIMANLNILERRQPQDGRITVRVGEENVDFRVSIVPVTSGESIVLRILGQRLVGRGAGHDALSALGFTPEQLVVLRSLLRIPHGLILVTGPTGSGKTTTLNAMLGEIVSDARKIISIEDPVEFLVDGVNQIQINEQIGLSFDVLLRRVLRQDPNVIMIGEIRDKATVEIAVRAALTGHLVLSTLHTNDAVSAIPRLINMGIEPYLIASVLRGVIAQRLVRLLCPVCKMPVPPTREETRFLQNAGINAEALYIPAGCPSCNHSGYAGRMVMAELFSVDAGLEERVMNRENATALSAYLRESGMRTLAAEGLRLAAEGQTTMAEVEREIALV